MKKFRESKGLKRNAVIAVVLLFVCAAVYLNWSYNSKLPDTVDADMAAAEDEAMRLADAEYAQTNADGDAGTAQADQSTSSEYFASARLTRQQSRDEALGLLETAAAAEAASQETIDSAMNEIACMATWSMQEAQIENLLLAKDFTDCVVFMSDGGVTVALPAPAEGLSQADIARVTETITSETDYTAAQIRIIEIKDEA